MKLKLYNGRRPEIFWRNFDNYHEPLWLNSINDIDNKNPYDYDQSWEDYCNDIFKDIGKIYWVIPSINNLYIEFYNEEDGIAFLLKWS